MRTLVKMFAVVLVLAALGGCLELWYQTYLVGKYYMSAGFFLTTLGALLPVVLIFLVVWIIIKIVKYKGDLMNGGAALTLLVILAGIQGGCSKAKANVQTLITDDCGVSWKLVKAGETVPARVGPCAFKITIPDYPMQGEVAFKTSFKNRVLARVEVSYEYVIVDGALFIGEAKYLGKMNSDVDDNTNSAAQYESAENAVIDKRIRDVAANMLIEEDIVDFSQGEFEDKLFAAVNERLKDKGVQLNFISFVPIPEEQTRLAIDMMTAMKIYESKGLSELGKAVAAARAGATQIQMGACGSDSKRD